MIVDFIESSSRAHLFESCGDESLCMKDFWHDRTYISSNCIKSGVMCAFCKITSRFARFIDHLLDYKPPMLIYHSFHQLCFI